MKLSVIVPIYKVEKYLRKCVDSILNQDLSSEEYEIILVDDGSPDGCGAIADEYASAHDNIRVIHQENGGLSVARNSGLEVAKGKYIQFVDSDDFLEPNVLGSLVRRMDLDGLDVLRFDYQNVNENYEVFQPYKDVKPFVDLRDEICDGLTFLNERLGYACYAVQFMIRRPLLVENKLFFKPGIYFEDTEWTPRMLLSARYVTSVGLVAYNYLLRLGSITKADSVEKKKKVLSDQFSLIDSLVHQKTEVGNCLWFDGMISVTSLSALTSIAIEFYSCKSSLLEELRAKNIYPLSLYHSTARSSRKIRLINCLSPHLFCLLLHLKNSI